jgi:nitric oxide reductase subunit B
MAMRSEMTADQVGEDSVSNVLKWILLAVAVATFGVLGWTIGATYEAAPPFPERFVSPDGTPLMSAADIQAGKLGFQKADLMDYGSLYGMGSYFGEDYTAANLVRLAALTQGNIAEARYSKEFSALTAEEQASVEAAMRVELQTVAPVGLSQSASLLGR